MKYENNVLSFAATSPLLQRWLSAGVTVTSGDPDDPDDIMRSWLDNWGGKQWHHALRLNAAAHVKNNFFQMTNMSCKIYSDHLHSYQYNNTTIQQYSITSRNKSVTVSMHEQYFTVDLYILDVLKVFLFSRHISSGHVGFSVMFHICHLVVGLYLKQTDLITIQK